MEIDLTAGVGAFYAAGHLSGPKTSLLDFAKATSGNNSNGTAVVRQDNSESSRGRTPSPRNISTGSGEVNRRTETQKRRTAHQDTSNSKPTSVKPPHFSIAP
jgi:hypothetical protein